MRLFAGRPHLPLLMLCFNCLVAENGNFDPHNHDGTKQPRPLVEAMGKIPKVYLESSWDDSTANSTDVDFPCPVASAIEPCVCKVDSDDGRLYLDCTYVISEEQLAAVFQQDFPVKEFYEFKMKHNRVVRSLHNFWNGVTFENLTLSPGPFFLKTISEDFLLDLKDTVKNIDLELTNIIADTFPFHVLPAMNQLTTLGFFGSDIDRIPPIQAPNLSSFMVMASPVKRLVNGTISVGPGEMFVAFYKTEISTIEPGSIFFADEESAASREPLSISLDGNRIQALQAGTFHLRNGDFKLEITYNALASIEPGTFVLPNASGNTSYGELRIDLSDNRLQSFQAGTFPLIYSRVHLDFTYNSLSSIEPGTFVLPEATGTARTERLFIDLGQNDFRSLQAGTFPLIGSFQLNIDENHIASIEPGTFFLPNASGDASYKDLWIDLNYNRLQSLQAGTFPLTNDRVIIYLNNNNISSIEPGTFVLPEATGDASYELLYIDISYNKLQSLQAGTIPLRNGAVSLYLNANNISSIEPGTFVLPEATDWMTLNIVLYENELTTIDEAVFGDLMPFITFLGLGGNPLACGCDIFWLLQNTTFMGVVDDYTRCADGTLLHDLNPEDFVAWCRV